MIDGSRRRRRLQNDRYYKFYKRKDAETQRVLAFLVAAFSYVKKRTKTSPSEPPFSRGATPRKAPVGHFAARLHVAKRAFPTPHCSRKALPALPHRKSRRVFRCCFCPEKATSSCRKAPVGPQRHCRRIAVRAPLQDNKGPVAMSRGPYGNPVRPFLQDKADGLVCKCLKHSYMQKTSK